MKLKNISVVKFSFLAALLLLLAITGCNEEDPIGLPPTADLETLITEAENLIATSVEGTSPGDFQPGSKQILQDVLTWVDWQTANATAETDLSKAATRLQKYINTFKTSTVQLAIPLFNNTSGSWIQISDNIKSVFAESFTVEIEAYYLGTNNWLQTLMSMEVDGPPAGFMLRLYNGNLDLIVANGTWAGASVPGAFKIGEWVHYAITKDGPLWKVYMNGVEVISTSPSPEMSPSSAVFTLGETATWKDRPYNGLLRDFRVWSGVRTVDQLIANKDEQLEGTEEGLTVYFPLDANLGNEFKDNTGNYTATFVGDGVIWAPGGIPPVIEIDYTALDAAIADAQALSALVVEGTNDGDYPVGTKAFVDTTIAQAIRFKTTAEKQAQVDDMVTSIESKLELVQDNLVGDAMGVYIDREDPDAVGLRITPNYTPQADYTVEFDLKIKTLFMESGDNGEIFGNGSFGLRIFGYNELSEQGVINSGGLWNFTNANDAWEGPEAPALTIKSGVWQHVAIVHDDVAKTTTIFVDGKEVGKQENFGAPLESGWGEIWLGNSWGGKMNGTIKDFRIWDAVKAPSELNAEIDGTEANLHIYFPLDKVAGVSFKDVTGNYNAELRGIVWEK